MTGDEATGGVPDAVAGAGPAGPAAAAADALRERRRPHRRQPLLPGPAAGPAPRRPRARTTSSCSPRGTRPGAYYVTLWTLGQARRTTTCGSSTRTARGSSGHPPAVGHRRDPVRHRQPGPRPRRWRPGWRWPSGCRGEPGRVFCLTVRRRVERGLVLGGADLRPPPPAGQPDDPRGPQRAPGLRHDPRGRRPRPAGREVPRPSACRPRRSTATTPRRSGGALAARPGRASTRSCARTRKGRGVSFMEDRMEWHYLPLTEAQYLQAVAGDRASMRNVFCQSLVTPPAGPTSCS